MHDPRHINFSREAFLHPVNLGFLLAVALTAFLMSGTPGMSTLIGTVGLGVELLYLGSVPYHLWFRNYIISREDQEKRRVGIEKMQFDQLAQDQQKKFLALKRIYDKIQANFDRMPDSSRALTDHLIYRLNAMLTGYLNHLVLQERYDEYLETASQDSLAIEIKALEKDMEQVTSGKLYGVMQRRREILKKRLSKFHQAVEKAKICISQQETIVDAVCYVYEKSVTMSNPEELGNHLDQLMTELEETSTIIQDIEDDLPPTYTVLNNMDGETAENVH